VIRELLDATMSRGFYGDSVEELTPIRRDALALGPLLAVGASVLLRPVRAGILAERLAGRHALTDAGWRQILARAT
jgi:hypothetical protein